MNDIKPRLLKVYGSQVWQCRGLEYWGYGWSPNEAYAHWYEYMMQHYPDSAELHGRYNTWSKTVHILERIDG